MKYLKYMVSLLVPFVVFGQGGIGSMCDNEKKEMNKEINDLEKLKALQTFVNCIDINEYSLRAIKRSIQFEIDVSESAVYKRLGKEKYENMIKEGTCQLLP